MIGEMVLFYKEGGWGMHLISACALASLGITLERMLTELSAELGWEAMGEAVPIRCFTHDPSIASSLRFLRRTPWAREQVEALFLAGVKPAARQDDPA